MHVDEGIAGGGRAHRSPGGWWRGGRAEALPARLTALGALTVISLLVLGGLGFAIYKSFQDSTYVAGENSIWVVGQIEPAALRYENALWRYTADPQAQAAGELRVASELLLSRMGIVDVHLGQGQLALGGRDAALWAEVERARPLVEAVADAETEAGLRRAAAAAAARVADFAEDVRRFNVRAMLVAVDKAEADRAALRLTVMRFAAASFLLVSLLVAAIWAMIYSYRNLRRSRAESATVRESLDRSYRLSGEGIMSVTREYRIVMANPAATRMFGIADGDPDNAFVHLVIRIGSGRDLETRRRAGEEIFQALCQALAPDQEQNPLALSCEIQEIDPELSWKKNNLAEWIAKRSRESA